MSEPIIYITTKQDGTMLMRSDPTNPQVARNRQAFLDHHGIKASNTTRLSIIYEGDDYCRYQELSDSDVGRGIIGAPMPACDALVTTKPGRTLLLPIADCIGAVLFDTQQEILMVSHLGRHSLEQDGAAQSVEYLKNKYDSRPENITVTLSPSAGGENYPLFAFNNRSMQDVAIEQLRRVGIRDTSIYPSAIDTTKDTTYFSHSEYLKGSREDDGRFAVIAYLDE